MADSDGMGGPPFSEGMVAAVATAGCLIFKTFQILKVKGKQPTLTPRRKKKKSEVLPESYPGSLFNKPGWEHIPRPCNFCLGMGLLYPECTSCSGVGHRPFRPRALWNPLLDPIYGKKPMHFRKCRVCKGFGHEFCPECDHIFPQTGLVDIMPEPDFVTRDEWGNKLVPLPGAGPQVPPRGGQS